MTDQDREIPYWMRVVQRIFNIAAIVMLLVTLSVVVGQCSGLVHPVVAIALYMLGIPIWGGCLVLNVVLGFEGKERE